MGPLIAKIVACELAQEARMQRSVEKLSDIELAALLDATYGAGTWDWLRREVDAMSGDDVERPGAVWSRYLQWRETQS